MTIEQINTLSLLHGLIATCGGSRQGFVAAAAESRDAVLKPMCIALGEQRAGFLRELRELGDRFGGVDAEPPEVDVHAERGETLRSAVDANDDARVLDVLVDAERATAEVYTNALEDTDTEIMPDVRTLVEQQREAITNSLQQLERLQRERAGRSGC